MNISEIFQKAERSEASNINSFSQRQNDLFSKLESAEKNILSTSPLAKNKNDEQSNERQENHSNLRKYLKPYRRQESIFKRPEIPINKCLQSKTRPDYQKNPDKWTKYSLNDVEDVTNQSNTKAALSFLRELESRKAEEGATDDKNIIFKSVKFNKSAMVKKIKIDNDEKASFRSSKVVMPEYVVGQTSKKNEKKRKSNDQQKDSKKELKLDHLLEDDENTE